MMTPTSFTATSLLGGTTELLVSAGYREIAPLADPFWSSPNTRLFEDQLGIVAILVYDTWRDLEQGWRSAQDQLVGLISDHLSSGEPKAWDGYLVLLTPSPLPSEAELDKIRYDVTRARKIVASGDELTSTSDLERVLAPLLPLEQSLLSSTEGTILARLPRILADHNIPELHTQAVIAAFLSQEPLMEKLDESRRTT